MYRIGIDLGGTNIAAGLVNEEMTLVKKMSIPTGAERAGEEIVKDMAKLCERSAMDLPENVSVFED